MWRPWFLFTYKMLHENRSIATIRVLITKCANSWWVTLCRAHKQTWICLVKMCGSCVCVSQPCQAFGSLILSCLMWACMHTFATRINVIIHSSPIYCLRWAQIKIIRFHSNIIEQTHTRTHLVCLMIRSKNHNNNDNNQNNNNNKYTAFTTIDNWIVTLIHTRIYDT